MPITPSKADADLAVNFVKLDDLSEDERRTTVEAGRDGSVITRDRRVEPGQRPAQVAVRITPPRQQSSWESPWFPHIIFIGSL
ncbi:hypothetical protein ACH5AG_07615 [Streptomyces anulatus]